MGTGVACLVGGLVRGVVLSGSLWVSGPVDGGNDTFLHFHPHFFHAVFKDHHVVDKVLAGGRAIEEVLRETSVFQGCSLHVQELA